MDSLKIAKQMIDFNKAAFNNTFNTMTALQEQTEKMVTGLMDKAPWLPEQGKKVVEDLSDSYKQGCENFKNCVDENFKRVESLFDSPTKTTRSKK